jgi:hypothetical protein
MNQTLQWVAGMLILGVAGTSMATMATDLNDDAAALFAGLALDCVHREYPNKIAHVLQDDEDVLPPRDLTPAFHGCFDWHSSVHGHWLLARLARTLPEASFAADARAALQRSLTAANLKQEMAYLTGKDRDSFERPYGLAWLLQLVAELDEWDDDQARVWREHLRPMEDLAAERFASWVPSIGCQARIGARQPFCESSS